MLLPGWKQNNATAVCTCMTLSPNKICTQHQTSIQLPTATALKMKRHKMELSIKLAQYQWWPLTSRMVIVWWIKKTKPKRLVKKCVILVKMRNVNINPGGLILSPSAKYNPLKPGLCYTSNTLFLTRCFTQRQTIFDRQFHPWTQSVVLKTPWKRSLSLSSSNAVINFSVFWQCIKTNQSWP